MESESTVTWVSAALAFGGVLLMLAFLWLLNRDGDEADGGGVTPSSPSVEAERPDPTRQH